MSRILTPLFESVACSTLHVTASVSIATCGSIALIVQILLHLLHAIALLRLVEEEVRGLLTGHPPLALEKDLRVVVEIQAHHGCILHMCSQRKPCAAKTLPSVSALLSLQLKLVIAACISTSTSKKHQEKED